MDRIEKINKELEKSEKERSKIYRKEEKLEKVKEMLILEIIKEENLISCQKWKLKVDFRLKDKLSLDTVMWLDLIKEDYINIIQSKKEEDKLLCKLIFKSDFNSFTLYDRVEIIEDDNDIYIKADSNEKLLEFIKEYKLDVVFEDIDIHIKEAEEFIEVLNNIKTDMIKLKE